MLDYFKRRTVNIANASEHPVLACCEIDNIIVSEIDAKSPNVCGVVEAGEIKVTRTTNHSSESVGLTRITPDNSVEFMWMRENNKVRVTIHSEFNNKLICNAYPVVFSRNIIVAKDDSIRNAKKNSKWVDEDGVNHRKGYRVSKNINASNIGNEISNHDLKEKLHPLSDEDRDKQINKAINETTDYFTARTGSTLFGNNKTIAIDIIGELEQNLKNDENKEFNATLASEKNSDQNLTDDIRQAALIFEAVDSPKLQRSYTKWKSERIDMKEIAKLLDAFARNSRTLEFQVNDDESFKFDVKLQYRDVLTAAVELFKRGAFNMNETQSFDYPIIQDEVVAWIKFDLVVDQKIAPFLWFFGKKSLVIDVNMTYFYFPNKTTFATELKNAKKELSQLQQE